MRAKSGKVHSTRRRKILKAAKGFRGARHRLYRIAKTAVMKAGVHAFASRKQQKRQMRSIWIVRINAAVRPHGISYSRFIDGLNKAGIKMDRKMLAEVAQSDPESFKKLVETVKAA